VYRIAEGLNGAQWSMHLGRKGIVDILKKERGQKPVRKKVKIYTRKNTTQLDPNRCGQGEKRIPRVQAKFACCKKGEKKRGKADSGAGLPFDPPYPKFGEQGKWLGQGQGEKP